MFTNGLPSCVFSSSHCAFGHWQPLLATNLLEVLFLFLLRLWTQATMFHLKTTKDRVRLLSQQPLCSRPLPLTNCNHFKSDALLPRLIHQQHASRCPLDAGTASRRRLSHYLCLLLTGEKLILPRTHGGLILFVLDPHRKELEVLVRPLWTTAPLTAKEPLHVHRTRSQRTHSTACASAISSWT